VAGHIRVAFAVGDSAAATGELAAAGATVIAEPTRTPWASLNARLEAQLKAAEARINEARAAAMGALHQVATDTATTVIARLTGASPDPRRVDIAVAAALTARGHG
jgi:hypothetical protein